MAIQIREARRGDGVELARLWLDMAEHLVGLDSERFRRPNLDGFAEAIDERLSQPYQDTAEFVAEVDGQLIGFVVVRRVDPVPNAERQILEHLGEVRAQVPALGVDSAWRRRGIGRRLMSRAETWALERGARIIIVDTYARSPLSNPFYRSLGYEVTSVTYERVLEATDRRDAAG
jgi:GNAT superfamily N-acetyltransferase